MNGPADSTLCYGPAATTLGCFLAAGRRLERHFDGGVHSRQVDDPGPSSPGGIPSGAYPPTAWETVRVASAVMRSRASMMRSR